MLLQAGVGAALPYLRDRIEDCTGASGAEDEQRAVAAIAQRIIATWQAAPPGATYRDSSHTPSRAEMMQLLCRLDSIPLLEQFIGGVVTAHYDGNENEAHIHVDLVHRLVVVVQRPHADPLTPRLPVQLVADAH